MSSGITCAASVGAFMKCKKNNLYHSSKETFPILNNILAFVPVDKYAFSGSQYFKPHFVQLFPCCLHTNFPNPIVEFSKSDLFTHLPNSGIVRLGFPLTEVLIL